MSFEIYPQSITVFPQDKQVFTVKSTPPPVIWGGHTNVTLGSDQSLQRTSGTGLFGSGVEQRVHSGIAEVVITFDSAMIPASGGYLLLQFFGVSSKGMFVTVNPSSTVVKDEAGTTLDTISRTIVAGDVYRMQIAGHILRLYINDVLSSTYTASAAVRYPIRYTTFGTGAFVVTPAHILAPVLVGVWDIAPDDSAQTTNWSATGGTLSAAADVWQTTYTAGDSPGVFAIQMDSESETLQTATAQAIVAPLSILGSLSVTLLPGQKVRFATNYDSAQNPLVAWSVVSGGGSFSNGEYTAATAPGVSVVKATYGNQRVDITVTVPVVITPSVTAATLGEVVTITSNLTGSVTWAADYGTASGSGATFLWTAPNQAGIVAKIKATNGTDSLTLEMPVLKKFAYDATLSWTIDRKKTVLIGRAEDRTRYSRVKDRSGLAYEAVELSFKNRDLTEFTAVETFYDEHYPGTKFIWEDKLRNKRLIVYFDSDLRHEGDTSCAIDYSFRVIEG